MTELVAHPGTSGTEAASTTRVVRVGEVAAAVTAGVTLAAMGLGSCIGLVLIHPPSGSVALAHVLLPAAPIGAATAAAIGPATYAPDALDALLLALGQVSAAPPSIASLAALIIGGARMFTGSAPPDGAHTGARNHAAIRAALDAAGVAVLGEDVGGGTGRSVWVHPTTCEVVVRAVGSPPRTMHPPIQILTASA